MWQFLFLASVFFIVVAFLKINQKSRRNEELDISKLLSTGKDYRFPIVGESSYQTELKHALSQEVPPFPVLLVPDDVNPYDHLAVKVMYRGTTI